MDVSVNPLLIEPDHALALPPFGRIRAADFVPALQQAMQDHLAEIDALATQAAPPDFDNTVTALDRSGALLARVAAIFHNLSASATSPDLQAVQRDMAGPLARHWSTVLQHEALFARLDAVFAKRQQLGLDAEQLRLCERLHNDFVRAGAQLPPAQRADFAALGAQLAQLGTRFAQNVLHDEAEYTLPLPDEAAMAGLPEFVRNVARQAATERGLPVPVVTLGRSSVVPFLSFSTRRDLREQAWRAWVARGTHDGEHDNRPVAREMLALRQRQARLMGHDTYADFKLTDTMAQTRQRVWALLDEVWQRALPAYERERQMLEAAMAQAGVQHPLQAWDWPFWAEQVRQAHYALDEAQLKPYFALPNMVAAAFECAQRLFGIQFVRRPDLQAYHPDVDVYAVRDAAGQDIGLFLHDNFARATKRSGAWMSNLTLQHHNRDDGRPSLPVVLNNNNFAKAAAGEATLLSPDDVRTLFHEFGHGLHGLLSQVRYARLACTQVLRDFVELPSQLYEHWGCEREVLRRHARHSQTGESIPDALIDKIDAARRFGQAYETVRYTASAIVDLAAHECATPIDDVVAFEQQVLACRGLPQAAGMNHHLPHFQHLFAGDSYASGYYVYLWAEVLEADAWEAFMEAGSAFDSATAQALRDCILSRGNTVEPGAAYRAFRGRDARIEPMLRGRGLID